MPTTHTLRKRRAFPLPLARPVHDQVPGDGGDGHVEEAAVEAPPRVEDGVVSRAGERVLPVGRNLERDDTLLGLAACGGV